ncbi:MAG: LL-diaminopimelate aminotransferase [Candidatus Schekmanbacteria bacterium RBG_13_48_7]|uniref:Aminotransferase n=1 Tax=Candidatus Schekmanbacteria bacterium RBG_13_48_7 TaxID=1817878 RepID=A0A1F7RSJ8_9BACT|nr:MAG: LL-diaminopimelate aminotransferase [Candidatus Schekmanbacteria bacterium RBG_13_48_7]
MKLAARLSLVPPYLFVEVRRKIAEAKSKGIDVISFGVGDPVEATPQEIIQSLKMNAENIENHCYPPGEARGMIAFRKAVADWYEKRFNVMLDPEIEIITLIGSKEGSHHLALAMINPGDFSIVPDPAYTTYEMSTLFSGGQVYKVPLLKTNNFLPDLHSIPEDIARKAKLIFINYPNNPTGATATKEFFKNLVDFAYKWNIVIASDNPYSEITFDGYKAPSILELEGAKDIAVEFNSLSKPFNMTGWRIGMAVGNRDVLGGIKIIKDNTDSGPFAAIQHAGITALKGYQKFLLPMIKIYENRRNKLMNVLSKLNLKAQPPKATFYVWAEITENIKSMEFTDNLLNKYGIVAIPGIGYGKHGEGFVRFSLTVPDHRFDEAMSRIERG